jgi:hypothetical protein
LAKRQAGNCCNRAEAERFSDELSDQAPAAGAERGPDDDLRLARGGTREHQERYVAAHQQHEQGDDEIRGCEQVALERIRDQRRRRRLYAG